MILIRMLLKVMHLGCRATSGPLVSCTAPVLQPKTPQSSFSSYITRCDLVPGISWDSSKFSSDKCVRLRLYRAQRNHVLFCTLDIDDTIITSHSYAAETLLIFAVMLSSIRVNFPHRFLHQCLAKNCPNRLWLFRTHFRLRALHHSIVQILGNCFVTDSLHHLFDVMGNVQPSGHETDCSATSQ